MAKKESHWEQSAPTRNDLKNVLESTKKFAEMYLTVLNDRRDVWVDQLEKQKKKEQDG